MRTLFDQSLFSSRASRGAERSLRRGRVLGALALAVAGSAACAPGAIDDEFERSEAQAKLSNRVTIDDIEYRAQPENPVITDAEAVNLINARLQADPNAQRLMPNAYRSINVMAGVTYSSGTPVGGYNHGLNAARKRIGAPLFGGEIALAHAELAFGAKGRKATQCDFPVEDEREVPGGFYSHFAYCSIWYSNDGAHEVHGAIRRKYSDLGFEAGFGFPTTDQQTEPDGVGASNQFSNGGGIYYHPSVGTHEVHGFIHTKFRETGGTHGVLGYPKSDEEVEPGSNGRKSTFQNGVIYWLPETGAHYVKGAILDKYLRMGASISELGFPTSDEQSLGGGKYVSNFQGGTITWNVNRAEVKYNQTTNCTNGTCETRPCKHSGEACCTTGWNHGCESGLKCDERPDINVCVPIAGGPQPIVKTCAGTTAVNAQTFYLGIEDDYGCGRGVYPFFADSLDEAKGCARAFAPGATIVESGNLVEYSYAVRSPYGTCNDVHVQAFSNSSASECAQAECTNCSVSAGSCF